MIISASRRTDIPAFHADWMMNRLREGFVYVRNPFNARQVSRVSLRREDAEIIVFWTKDASPMLPRLDEVEDRGYRYLFQYTLTPYGQDVERGVDKRRALDAMTELSERIGSRRVIWRYDPIILTDEWTPERHIGLFEKMCARLEGVSARCVISFVDLYASVRRNAGHLRAPEERQMRTMAREMAGIARAHGMLPSACAEALDFSEEGLEEYACIDRRDVEAVLGMPVRAQKDTGQRPACRCMKSVDIGAYDTCGHGCIYCYARTKPGGPAPCDPELPVLGGGLRPEDRISDRMERRIAEAQTSFWE